ncbi:MAG: hypothetical protein RI988_41 [Pseudomonadota bacterium]|jgi:hypothetical protein
MNESGRAPWRAISVTGIAALMVAHSVAAIANESSCYAIRDGDRKNMCLAQAKRQDSYCYAIRNADDKHMCLALVKQRRSECYSIRSSDLKNQCLAQVR